MKFTTIAVLILTAGLTASSAADAKPSARSGKSKKPASRQTQVYRNPCPVSPEQRLCGTVARITRRCRPNWFDPYTGYYHERCYVY